MEYETVIGLEVHCQLKTNTKVWCSCDADYDNKHPNTSACPVCTGQPGALPKLNEKVLDYAIKAALALGCEINEESQFDRKNYFYPDLSKGYQISQADKPIAENGVLEIEMEDGKTREIRIERIHMEEDTAKLNYDNFGRGTLIDFNRGGIPLVEIVSKPDIHSIKEALLYLETLRKLLIYLEIAECKMEEGGFRADVNISVSNTDTLRTKSRN